MADDREAFVESGEEQVVRRAKNLRLPLDEDGNIDWNNAADKQKKAFIEAIKNDPAGILQNIQEEAAGAPSGPQVADATVLTCVNILMTVEALGVSVFPGPKMAPVLHHLPAIVAIKACTVSMEELQPVMEPAKRIVAEFMPPQLLLYQDFVVVGEHLLKLSAAKFRACLELAMEIEKMKMQQLGSPDRANGHAANVVAGQ
jgi:hypothetical protein